MKVISLWQPWASLMALDIKHIETRPCIFDRIDDVYLDDETWIDEQVDEFDPEVAA